MPRRNRKKGEEITLDKLQAKKYHVKKIGGEAVLKHRKPFNRVDIMQSDMSVSCLQMIGLTLLYPYSKNR